MNLLWRLLKRDECDSTIFYVVDNEQWVQVQRFKYIKKYLPEFSLKLITIDRFITLWKKAQLQDLSAYISSWRSLHPLWKEFPERFTKETCHSLIVGVTSHSNIGGGLNPTLATNGRKPEDAFKRAIEMLSNFRAVTVNSMILYELLKESIAELHYCPNGVDADFFSPGDRTYDAHNIKIGWIGKMRSAKNISTLEEACAILEREGFSPRLIKIPKNSSEEDIMSSGEMRDFYRSIDYYLCASWDEGTPNPALEAAACGVPIVTTRVGNMRELIEHGINGFFIDPTVPSIIETFRHLKNIDTDFYMSMSKKIRQDILRDWTWAKNIANYRPVINKLNKKCTGIIHPAGLETVQKTVNS